MRIPTSLIALFVLGTTDAEAKIAPAECNRFRVLAYFDHQGKDEQSEFSSVLMNPQSKTPLKVKLRANGKVTRIADEFLHTALDLEIVLPKNCVTLCEGELRKVRDVIAPFALKKELATRKPQWLARENCPVRKSPAPQ